MKECACFTCKYSYDSGEYDICQCSDELCDIMCIEDCAALNNTGKEDLCDYCQNSDYCGLMDGDTCD